MKQFENDRHVGTVYNKLNNHKNKIYSGLSYEFDYEFASELDNDDKSESIFNKRQHKREIIKKKKNENIENKK